MNPGRLLLGAVVCGLMLLPLAWSGDVVSAGPDEMVQSVIEGMTPEEKVGQLVLVTFRGSVVEAGSPIVDLIVNHHVGGVILSAENDNFVDAPDIATNTRTLIDALQSAEYEASLAPNLQDPESGFMRYPSYVPLFVAIQQEGNGRLYTAMLSGVTELPSEMAIGGSWNTELARGVGEVQGRELEAMGINLVIGPPLDVLEDPRVGGQDLGVSVFGGDPYWVGMMGQAYVSGLHSGSRGRLAVVAKHFPGLGSSDRPVGEEVATIRKSLERLIQFDLAPFFAAASAEPGSNAAIVDGLLMSHIRYQGFQGNIRATTRPVSLDQQAFATLMSLDALKIWREGGGLTVSDSLGSRAVRRFYDPSERVFNAHLVARDALAAGNDLLILSDFKGTSDADEVSTITATLAFLAQKYRDDAVFAMQVDAAVSRIVTVKLRLYGGAFSAAVVRPSEAGLAYIGKGEQVSYDVAREAATLISPTAEELAVRLSEAPQVGQRIVFFTDVRQRRQCSTCDERAMIDLRAMQETVLRLYGPLAAGQVESWNVDSFRMADLASYLGEQPPEELIPTLRSAEDVEDALTGGDWVVFISLGEDEEVYGSDALSLLLDQRPDIARQARLVVFAFDVPYELDATDISKVDAYFALYGCATPFLNVAARLLFQEATAVGASPVSVPGVDYELMEVLAPEASQVIKLAVLPGQEGEAGLGVGDLIVVETDVIRDSNGHPVPDGTPVQFKVWYEGEGTPPLTVDATTVGGKAQMSRTLERVGVLTIQAESYPARSSDMVQLNVEEGALAFATVIPPTAEALPSPTATQEVVQPVSTQPPPPAESAVDLGERSGIGMVSFILVLVGIGLVAAGCTFWVWRQGGRERGTLRPVLVTMIPGLVVYNYLALQLPGSASVVGYGGLAAIVVLSMVAASLGWAGWFLWLRKRAAG